MKKIIIMGIIAIFFVVFLGYYFVNSKNTDEISGTVSSLEIVQNNINIGEIPMDQ